LDCYDETDFPILERYFPQLLEFITAALNDPDARVYIHCVMGINRSAALAVAYACHVSGLSATEVIAATRAGTGRTLLSNNGFVAQLCARFPATAVQPTQ
jgi:protein-tyrosine phosphatase